MKQEPQYIYICMDDSGVLSENEPYACFGGLVFTSKSTKDKFRKSYYKIVDDLKCGYCDQNMPLCNRKCVEIKNLNLHSNHKRWIMNLIKKEYAYCVVIENRRVSKYVFESKESKNRFLDYAKKRVIKRVVEDLINKSIIDLNKPVFIEIECDQSNTATNGYFNSLRESVLSELKHGTVGDIWNGLSGFKPTLRELTDVSVTFHNSKTNTLVQAADLIAGSTRRHIVKNGTLSPKALPDFIDILLILP